jgi:hypothetical protein
MKPLLALLALLVVVPACKNELGGSLTVDGKAFEMDSCRSGEVYGFSGVEVTAKSGDRLRLVQTPTGEGQVILLGSGADTGTDLGTCGPLKVSQQNSTINNIKNVEGKAKLDCSAAGHTIKGTVSFGNCH